MLFDSRIPSSFSEIIKLLAFSQENVRSPIASAIAIESFNEPSTFSPHLFNAYSLFGNKTIAIFGLLNLIDALNRLQISLVASLSGRF
ncbi:hypothetical protein D3C87_849060 [compost metagenome]